MPNDNKHKAPDAGEIDLLYVFVKLGESIKKAILNLFIYIGMGLVFLLQKWYYFVFAIILTLASAWALNKASDAYYHSSLDMRSNAINNQPLISRLEKLGDYAGSKNYTALSEKLDLPLDESQAIKGIKTFWYYDIDGDGIFDGIDISGKILKDTSIAKVDSVFNVQVEVYDPNILNLLEKQLVYYLESDPFLHNLNGQRIANLKAELDQINYEIEKLDSLQKREYYTNPDDIRQKEGQVVFTTEKVVRMYHTQMFNLLDLKQDCERDINIYGSVVTVVESFNNSINPENGIIHYAKKLIWYFLLFALLFSIIITYRKKIWTTKYE